MAIPAKEVSEIKAKYSCINCQTENELALTLADINTIVNPSNFGPSSVTLFVMHNCSECNIGNQINLGTI